MIFTCQSNITWIGQGNPDEAALQQMRDYLSNAETQGLTDGNVTVTWDGDAHSYLRNWTTIEGAENYCAFHVDLGCHAADVIRL